MPAGMVCTHQSKICVAKMGREPAVPISAHRSVCKQNKQIWNLGWDATVATCAHSSWPQKIRLQIKGKNQNGLKQSGIEKLLQSLAGFLIFPNSS
jgi:hypothetical protein